MSRIHDALKRAETEQTDYPVERPQPRAVPASIEEGPEIVSAAPATPSFSIPLTLEALQERATIRTWNPDPKRMLFFGSQEAAALEIFRTLRSRLYQVREKLPIKKLLVAGATGDEGISFVAANLAQVMVQQQGLRTLLIDADLRQGKLHSDLGAPASPGLSEYLSGHSEELATIQRGPMENLFFLPCGKTVSNPLELLGNGRIKTLLSRLEPLFDWIILDSAPATTVSDAGQLANYCDGVLLVVRSNATSSDLAVKARDEFYGRKIVGVVLNGVKPT
jgi:capsular exopolysaccharide synthesis family protein